MVAEAGITQPPANPMAAPLAEVAGTAQQQQQQAFHSEEDSDPMVLDGTAAGEHPPPAQPSCSPSPLVRPGGAVTQPQQHSLPSGFVPVGELGGGSSGCASGAACSDGEEPSSQPPSAMERPASATGYESGDDMDMQFMRHCTNCTGPLWGHICMDCGHMSAHDDDIFHPTVAPAATLHRPRLQGDALTVICWDERMELHQESGSSMHPERPDRVRAVMARLRAAELAGRCRNLPAREATPEEVGACHIPELLEAVELLAEQSRLQGNAGLHFSPDTYVNQHTAMCAKLSAGACVDIATAVVRQEARAGVAVVRPPGHHAESNTAMGFCFFNNAGIAARAAQAAGAERVLVLDWDVHHGNGTQHIFEGDSSVLYMSLHRYDGGSFYPGTGAAHEVGEGGGEGYSVNVPWPCGGMRNADYMAAFSHVVLPIAYEYAPDLVIISAGFDAAEGDPIGGCHLTPECYAHMAAQLQLVAPTVALLEGGYNLMSTAKGTEAVVRVLLGERPPPLPAHDRPACADALRVVAQVMRIQSRYWQSMRGLVQQQFKVLAAAAARQEQLAAMKARRLDAGPAGASAGGEEDEQSPRSGLCGSEEQADAGMGEDGEEEDPLLGSMHVHRHHGMHEGLDEDADTPPQQYRGGSGWESDADLASGEEQLSSGEEDEDGADEHLAQQREGQQPGGQPPDEDAAVGEGGSEQGGTSGCVSAGHGHGPAAEEGPPKQQEQLHGSETLPISDSEGPGSATTSDGHSGAAEDGGSSRPPRPAGLTSASLSPAGEGGIITPAGEQLLRAASVLETPAAEQQQQQPASGAQGSGGAPALRPAALAAQPLVLKRPGHVASHQRLSPALSDDAMQLVQAREQGRGDAAGASAESTPAGQEQ